MVGTLAGEPGHAGEIVKEGKLVGRAAATARTLMLESRDRIRFAIAEAAR